MAATTPTTITAGLTWTTLATGQKYVTVKMEGQGTLELVLDTSPPAATVGRKGVILEYLDGGIAEFGDVEDGTLYARLLDTTLTKDVDVTVITHTPS